MNIDDLIALEAISGWDIVIALVIVIAAWLLSRYTRRSVRRMLSTVDGLSDTARALVARLCGYLVLLVGAGFALSFLGAQLQPLLTAAVLVAAIAVIALRGIAENAAAGVVIQTRQPIRIGDEIEMDTYQGLVRELNSRSVIIETADGDRVHLPNRLVLNNPLTNRSALGGRRTDIQIRAATSRPADEVRGLILEAAAAQDQIRTDPPPRVFLRQWQPERPILLLKIWHEPANDDAVISAAIAAMYEFPRRPTLLIALRAVPGANLVVVPQRARASRWLSAGPGITSRAAADLSTQISLMCLRFRPAARPIAASAR